jgi:hypothetical protein
MAHDRTDDRGRYRRDDSRDRGRGDDHLVRRGATDPVRSGWAARLRSLAGTVIGSALSLFPLLGRTPPRWRRAIDVVATSLGAHAIDVATVAAGDGPFGRVER